jgi:biopolymer transport protein ExbD
MAGCDSEDNPLPVNVVPMVDVIFCLCVFFLASYHQRPSESRFDTWLPKDRGSGPEAAPLPLTELRVVLRWRPATGEVTRCFGQRDLRNAGELAQVLREAHEELVSRNRSSEPLIVDAEPGVPWAAVVEVVDLGRELRIERLQFAQGPR